MNSGLSSNKTSSCKWPIHPYNYFKKSPLWTREGKFPNRGIDAIKLSLHYPLP